MIVGGVDIWSIMAHDFPVARDGWSYDGDVLTLTNCTITDVHATTGMIPGTGTGGMSADYRDGLAVSGDLTIRLVGENKISIPASRIAVEGFSEVLACGINSRGNLTIVGDGSLTIEFTGYNPSGCYGLRTDGMLTIGTGSDCPRLIIRSADIDAALGTFGETVGVLAGGIRMNSGDVYIESGHANNADAPYMKSQGVQLAYSDEGINIYKGSFVVKCGSADVAKAYSFAIDFGSNGPDALSCVYDCYFLAENAPGVPAYSYYSYSSRIHASSYAGVNITHRWRHDADAEWYDPATAGPHHEVFGSQADDCFRAEAHRMEYAAASRISYDANGGTGTMADQTVFCGETITLPACGFTAPAGMQFKCWQIGGKEYPAGGSITVMGGETVKARWEKTGTVPATGDGTTLLLLSALALTSLCAMAALRRRRA